VYTAEDKTAVNWPSPLVYSYEYTSHHIRAHILSYLTLFVRKLTVVFELELILLVYTL